MGILMTDAHGHPYDDWWAIPWWVETNLRRDPSLRWTGGLVIFQYDPEIWRTQRNFSFTIIEKSQPHHYVNYHNTKKVKLTVTDSHNLSASSSFVLAVLAGLRTEILQARRVRQELQLLANLPWPTWYMRPHHHCPRIIYIRFNSKLPYLLHRIKNHNNEAANKKLFVETFGHLYEIY